mgnify:CR=1 FL=1
MNEREFRGFINSDLVNFMELHKLEEVQVKDGNSNKAKIKRGKNNTLHTEITIKEEI